jgi:hypothetical protein
MLLLVAGAFVVTFLVVCLVAYLVLSKSNVDPTGPPSAHRVMSLGVLPGLLPSLVAFAVILGIIYVAVTAINHVDTLLSRRHRPPGVPLIFRWEIPPILAVAVLAIGLPLARRFRRPARFRVGVVLVAVAFATLWPLQFLAASFDLPFWEYNAFLHGLALFISLCLLSGGLETLRRASNTPEADSWEFLE